MHRRVDAGTDIAMVGAWDQSRQAPEVCHANPPLEASLLESDAKEGHLFVIHTGADGGGPIDVYIDAEVPSSIRKKNNAKEGGVKEFLLSVPTGKLVVGGVED